MAQMQFREFFINQTSRDREKLEKIYDLLKRVKGLEAISFLARDENPFIYIRPAVKSSLYQAFRGLKLGIRLYIIGDNLTYRLQQGPKGIGVGPGKPLENQETLLNLVQQGKDETEAYNEIVRKIPNELTKFMERVLQNLENKVGSKRTTTDAETYRGILNAIVTSTDVAYGSTKM
jgi:hypothetical protein